MKRLLPLLLLLLSINAIAQDYACIIPTDTSYFINADGYLRGIRIDSVRTVGSATLYFPFKTERLYTGPWPPPPNFDTSNGCWLGGKIAKESNGIFRFHSYWFDTIFINTFAMPGDSWTFYTDTTSRRYLATVMGMDTLTIKGVVDSVKKIQITAYLGGTVNLADSVHGFEILLSKHHGFASVFDLYMFPYLSPTGTTYQDAFSDQIGAKTRENYIFNQVEFHLPTFHELYDFNIGDVFITGNDANTYMYTDLTIKYDSIISKTIISPTTTTYVSMRKTQNTLYASAPPVYSYNEGPYTIYASPEFAIPSSTLPEEAPESQTIWWYRPNDTNFCSNGAYYERKRLAIFEGCVDLSQYKKGLPRLMDAYPIPNPPFSEYCAFRVDRLVFSVKNGVHCGTRYNVVPVSTTEITPTTNTFTIYPNPANETLNLKDIDESTEIFITDITGRRVISTRSSAKETSIDVSQLAPGTYIIRINDARQTFIKQ